MIAILSRLCKIFVVGTYVARYLHKAINRVLRLEVKYHPELKGYRYVVLKNENCRDIQGHPIVQFAGQHRTVAT